MSLPILAVTLAALLAAISITLVALIIANNRRPEGRTEEV